MDDDALSRLALALRARDPAGFASCLTPDAELLIPHSGGELAFTGREAVTGACGTLLSASPDLTYTAARRYVTPREVIEEASLEGRHVGVFAGVPGSGERVRVGIRISARLDGAGLIRQLTAWPDMPALWAQLGVRDSASAAANAVVASARDQAAGGVQVIKGVAPPTGPAPARAASAPAPGRPARRRGPGWWARHRRGVLGLAGLAAAAGITAWVVFGVVLATPSPTVGAAHPTATATATSSSPRPTPTPSASRHPEVVPPVPSAVPTVQRGKRVVLKADLLFALGKADLTPAAHAKLQALAATILDEHVHGQIQVNGYTDNQGSAAMNLDLSKARAKAVATALAQLLPGVQDVRLAYQGFGETHPAGTNATTAGRANNRRVTVVLPQP